MLSIEFSTSQAADQIKPYQRCKGFDILSISSDSKIRKNSFLKTLELYFIAPNLEFNTSNPDGIIGIQFNSTILRHRLFRETESHINCRDDGLYIEQKIFQTNSPQALFQDADQSGGFSSNIAFNVTISRPDRPVNIVARSLIYTDGEAWSATTKRLIPTVAIGER